MKLNRREFLTGCASALPALFLPKIGHEELPADVPLQDTVKINGVMFENATTKEVFEHGDYYLHVKMPARKDFPEWLRFYNALRGCSRTEFSSNKHKVEIIQRHIKQEYTGVYYGCIRYDDDIPGPSITLYFLLESSTSSLIAHPKTCLFISYNMLRANKLWWSQGDE